MGRKHTLDGSLNRISEFFDSYDAWAFTSARFYQIVKKNSNDWDVPLNRGLKYVLRYLQKKGLLFTNIFQSSDNRQKEIYSWRTQEDYTVMSGLKPDSYFCFYTAMFLHGLTLQIPKTYYLNAEHYAENWDYNVSTEMLQEDIDDAFSREQRKSGKTFTFQDKRIIVTNGKYTGKLGVVHQFNDKQHFHFTDIERTLIDCAVRPVYAGGVVEVKEAFRLAMEQLDVNKLKLYLDKLGYIYPYHQVIGFYLEKAGCEEKYLKLFEKEHQFKFYLTYNMRRKEFSERWNLYYPFGL